MPARRRVFEESMSFPLFGRRISRQMSVSQRQHLTFSPIAARQAANPQAPVRGELFMRFTRILLRSMLASTMALSAIPAASATDPRAVHAHLLPFDAHLDISTD